MRILINEKKGTKLYLALPTRLVLNSFTTNLILKGLKSRKGLENINFSKDDMKKLFDVILRMKKKYPNCEIVDIHSADGDIVKIKL